MRLESTALGAVSTKSGPLLTKPLVGVVLVVRQPIVEQPHGRTQATSTCAAVGASVEHSQVVHANLARSPNDRQGCLAVLPSAWAKGSHLRADSPGHRHGLGAGHGNRRWPWRRRRPWHIAPNFVARGPTSVNLVMHLGGAASSGLSWGSIGGGAREPPAAQARVLMSCHVGHPAPAVGRRVL